MFTTGYPLLFDDMSVILVLNCDVKMSNHSCAVQFAANISSLY